MPRQGILLFAFDFPLVTQLIYCSQYFLSSSFPVLAIVTLRMYVYISKTSCAKCVLRDIKWFQALVAQSFDWIAAHQFLVLTPRLVRVEWAADLVPVLDLATGPGEYMSFPAHLNCTLAAIVELIVSSFDKPD